MRVVHVVESFAAGVLDFLVDLTSGMEDVEHVVVYGLREDTPPDFREKFKSNVEFVRWHGLDVSRGITGYLRALSVLRGVLVGCAPDVVHLHSSKAGFLGRLVARTLGLQDRVIYTSHGASFLRKDISVFKQKTFIMLERIAYYAFGGRVVACSRSESEEFARNQIMSSYIYNGVNCSADISVDCKSVKVEGSDTGITVVTSGRIVEQKGPAVFNAVAQQFQDDVNVRFLWVGDGPMRHVLSSSNIQITGWLPHSAAFAALSYADIYLSTSRWEGLPLSVLKAMCLFKPLVLSRCVGNVDVVVERGNGYLFDNESTAVGYLRELINDSMQRDMMGRESERLVREVFSLGLMLKKYRESYDELLSMCA